ncbi:MAG: hypothetical protein M9932_09410 [Xanthobacteraceae bacterium]|nr:hypothetical protein [Xanthobacteraceae bacterium]
MRRTPAYIICSPRPRVGKTLIARLLCEFLLLQRGGATGFDVNLKEPSLLDFLPRTTETAEIDDTFGKMALMDRLILNDGAAKVIDLGFHAFDEFFTMTGEIGFFKEAARRGIAPMVLFVADSDRVSARSYAMLQATVPTRALITVDNEYVLRGEMPAIYRRGRQLKLPALPAFLNTYIDRTSFSFTGFLRGQSDRSSELHQWIRDAYFSFRELELSLLLQGG